VGPSQVQYAVADDGAGVTSADNAPAGIDIGTVGVILMVIGTVGLAVGLWLPVTGRGSADQSM
jgi:hypothetical protein